MTLFVLGLLFGFVVLFGTVVVCLSGVGFVACACVTG